MPSWERRPRPREAAPLRAWNGVDAVARVATARDETGENAARARRPNLNPPADGAGIVSCAHCYKRYKTVELLREHERDAGHSRHDPRCGECGKHFACVDTLRQHLGLTTGPSAARCKSAFEARGGCARCVFIPPSSPATTDEADAVAASASARRERHRCPFDVAAAPARGRRRAVAVDCEMVGDDVDGGGAMCARVCVVDERGTALLSTHVAPTRPVTDYRTELTGVTEESLRGAPSFEDVRARVLALIRGGGGGGEVTPHDHAFLVGHDLAHDLECLDISHEIPRAMLRDTATYAPFKRHTHRPYKLRTLAEAFLGLHIQTDGVAHDPREDAHAAMRLYLGARDSCEVHHPDVDAREAAAAGKGEERGADGACGAPRFRCWCGDKVGAETADADGDAPRRGASASTSTTPTKAGKSRAKGLAPSPVAVLKDATNVRSPSAK